MIPHWKTLLLSLLLLILIGSRLTLPATNVILPTAGYGQLVTQIAPTSTHVEDDLLIRLQDLMALKADCILPCFAELKPGGSDGDDIAEFISKYRLQNYLIEEQINHKEVYNFSFHLGENGLLTIGLSTQSDLLQKATIGISNPADWLDENLFNLSKILESLGEPEEVFISFSGPPLGFTTILLYNQKGVLIRYQSELVLSIDDNQPIPICFSEDQVNLYQIDVWLQSTDDKLLVETNQSGLRDSRQEVRPFWPLEQVINMDMSAFTEFFLEHEGECLAALSPRELRQDGYVF